MSDFPTTCSGLVFPFPSGNLSNTLSSLKRSTLSTRNRLHSIQEDSYYVQSVASSQNLPLIANERCGSWYIPLDKKAASAYFKSTDGHWQQWAFSTRRLNLHILEIIGKSAGCVIVDSTRRGKSMPDALSKTIPIWCSVFNRLLFPGLPLSHKLRVPVDIVGSSEQGQIEARLERFVEDAKSLHLEVCSLRRVLKKPLYPIWTTPDSSLHKELTIPPQYNKIICCTSSRRVEGAELLESGYIQGAGDDSEGWAHGLTPTVFWKHHKPLLEAMEEDLPKLISTFMASEYKLQSTSDIAVRLGPTTLYIGTKGRAIKLDSYDGIIICTDDKFPARDIPEEPRKEPRTLHLKCTNGKLGSRAIRTQLHLVVPFVNAVACRKEPPSILFICSTGKDLSVAVALAVLCLFYDDDYHFSTQPPSTTIDKAMIRRRLSLISTFKPDISPSRSTLQSVHSFLMPQTI